jgi:hypothetical protein
MKKKKNTIFAHALTTQRDSAKNQGFFDGRFALKIIRNKKKQADKIASRIFKQHINVE